MSEISELVRRADLLALVESDLGPGKRSGRWYLFSCPFPGHKHGDRRPSLTVTPDNGRFFCFACRKSGDAYTWLKEYRKLDHQTAIEVLGGLRTLPAPVSPRPAQPVTEPTLPPAEMWQRAALAFVESSERALWEPVGARALAWLREKRGLTDRTIKQFRLGYNPALIRPAAESWGCPGDNPDPLYIPRGVVIPGLVAGECWYIKIRQSVGNPKYINIRGGRPALFGADNLIGAEIVLLTEGEFDAILAHQELNEFCGVATLGSATKRLDLETWGRYLLPARLILTAYDLDKAGADGRTVLAEQSDRVHYLPVPRLNEEDKDITDYWNAGGDLKDWLNYHLDRIDPIPYNGPFPMLETCRALGGVARDYGAAMLDYAERASKAGDQLTFARAFACAMILEGDDPHKWAGWAECEYQVPAGEILQFAELVRS